MKPEKYPSELFEGAADEETRVRRMGFFLILDEMGFFGDKTNVKLATEQYNGSFVAAVRKRFSGTYGDVAGCHPADIEVAAEMVGVPQEVLYLTNGGKYKFGT